MCFGWSDYNQTELQSLAAILIYHLLFVEWSDLNGDTWEKPLYWKVSQRNNLNGEF